MQQSNSGCKLRPKAGGWRHSEAQQAQPGAALLREGVIKGLSIGYQVVKHDYDSTRNVRLLKELKLYEVSVVTFPANELATVTATTPKDGKGASSDEIAQALREIRQDELVVSALKELRHNLAAKAGRGE